MHDHLNARLIQVGHVTDDPGRATARFERHLRAKGCHLFESTTRRDALVDREVGEEWSIEVQSFNDGDETAYLEVIIAPSLGSGYGLVDVRDVEPWRSLRSAPRAGRA